MDLCLNEVLIAGNIIPEHIRPGESTAAAAGVIHPHWFLYPGFFNQAGLPIYFQKAARRKLFCAVHYSNN